MQGKGQKIEAVIFDLDGTLVDSEPNYMVANQQVLGEYGICIDEAFQNKYVGISSKETMEELKAIHNIAEPVEELLIRKNACYLALAKTNTVVFPEMRKFVELLQKHHYPMAVASGSALHVVETILAVTNLRQYFAVAISSDQVERSKPAPDVFLAAAGLLKVAPERCLVLEDSRHGVEAAKQARMRCIALPYLFDQPLHDSFRAADLLCERGIQDFFADQALAWINRFNR